MRRPGGWAAPRLRSPSPSPFPPPSPNPLAPKGGTFGPGVSVLPMLGNLPGLPILPFYPNRLSASVDGSTFIVTVGVRYELPTQTTRFRPYLSGGLGINNTDQEVRIETL